MEENLALQQNPIILFDSNSNIEELKKILHTNPLIISFDYETHQILEKNNIMHQISDNFVTRDDLVQIQNKCYDFVKWYETNPESSLIEYEGINLGSTIEVELNYFLVSFIKSFVEIAKIFARNSHNVFIVSPKFYETISLFTNHVTKFETQTTNNQDFYYDSINTLLKIGGHNFNLHLSKSQFDKLKKLFEITLDLFFNPKKINHNNKTVLLVEFNTISYKKIFEALPNIDLNLILYNRRRPAIWNLETYSIIQKSGCRLVTHHTLLDANTENKIKNIIQRMESNIKSIWNDDTFYISFFSINGISFWKILKPILVNLFKKRSMQTISEIEMTKNLLKKYKFNAILVWSEIGSTEQLVVKLAKRFGIPIVLLQHGLFYDSDSDGAYRMNKFQGVFPVYTDKYVVWGRIEEKHQLQHDHSNQKLVVLGSPLHDNTFSVPESKYSDYILLATSGPVKENALDLTVDTIEKNKQVIKKICEVVSKMNKNLIIKLHPSPNEFDPSEMIRQINPKITILKTDNITPLIKSCQIFIMIDASTVILDAHLLRKPVISVLVKDSDYGIPSVLQNSCVTTNIENFENVFTQVLNDEIFRKTLINKGTSYVNEYLINQDAASEKLLSFLYTI